MSSEAARRSSGFCRRSIARKVSEQDRERRAFCHRNRNKTGRLSHSDQPLRGLPSISKTTPSSERRGPERWSRRVSEQQLGSRGYVLPFCPNPAVTFAEWCLASSQRTAMRATTTEALRNCIWCGPRRGQFQRRSVLRGYWRHMGQGYRRIRL